MVKRLAATSHGWLGRIVAISTVSFSFPTTKPRTQKATKALFQGRDVI
jgi:hypothetical protein